VISRDDSTGGKGEALDAKPYYNQFIEAMDDDFNTPKALAALFDLARAINQAGDADVSFVDAKGTLSELACNVLGVKLEAPKQISGQMDNKIDKKEIAEMRGEKLDWLLDTIENTVKDPNKDIEMVRGYVNLAVGVRDSLREHKQYKRADEIRKRLMSCGFIIEDTATIPRWVYKPVSKGEL
jgi:cysteinyl-tRNA synthetase